MAEKKPKPKQRTGATKAGRNKPGYRGKPAGRFRSPGEPTVLEAAYADRAAAREAEQLEFRTRQAGRAAELIEPSLQGLARKVAEGIIERFPAIEVPEGSRRTREAEHAMVLTLTGEEQMRIKAINRGASEARRVLRQAYDELTSQPPLLTASA